MNDFASHALSAAGRRPASIPLRGSWVIEIAEVGSRRRAW
jgi:hypothetical protein